MVNNREGCLHQFTFTISLTVLGVAVITRTLITSLRVETLRVRRASRRGALIQICSKNYVEYIIFNEKLIFIIILIFINNLKISYITFHISLS